MASESEKTPESVEVNALEDLKAEHTALLLRSDGGEPSGRPVTYGPGGGAMAMYPSWSEMAREEAMLRSMRPLELPPPERVSMPTQPVYSRPKDMDPVVMQAMFQKVMEENARLWAENQKFGVQHPATAPGDGCPEGWYHGSASTAPNTMGSLWEEMQTTVQEPPGGDLLNLRDLFMEDHGMGWCDFVDAGPADWLSES